jgi:hypothetical protein
MNDFEQYSFNQKREDYIHLNQCKRGFLYKIHSRNLRLGVYDGEEGFIGIRTKFNQKYLFTEMHWQTGPPYGTVKPLEELCQLPRNIPCHTDDVHAYGSSDYAIDPETGEDRPVLRRNLRVGEPVHGRRQGFVDEWAGTAERLPDRLYPFIKGNNLLFKWLEEKEKEYCSHE